MKMLISACPNGWEWRADFSKCYIYRDDLLMTWNEANEMCMTLDPDGEATLTSVDSQEENDYIFSLIDFWIWLGGTDEAEEGMWRWVNLKVDCCAGFWALRLRHFHCCAN